MTAFLILLCCLVYVTAGILVSRLKTVVAGYEPYSLDWTFIVFVWPMIVGILLSEAVLSGLEPGSEDLWPHDEAQK